ncbi:hypothetical protein ACLMJK_001656 [Lecanora helva]
MLQRLLPAVGYLLLVQLSLPGIVSGVEERISAPSVQISEPPIGLSLGPELITVATEWQNLSSGPVVQLQGSKPYQIWFADIARDKKITREASLHILTNTLRHVQSSTNDVFGRPVHVTVVAVPGEIRREKTKAVIADAILELGFCSKETLQFLDMKNAAHYAYDLGSPGSLGLDVCDWDAEMNEAVIVDYNAAYLGLYLIDIKNTRAFKRAHATFSHLGENVVRSDRATPNTMQAHEAIVSDQEVQRHIINILQMLDGFLSEYLVKEYTPANVGTDRKPLRSDIRAVILTGDASAKGFEHLRAVLRHLFSNLHPSWLKDSIDPSTVIATGAAKRAFEILRKSKDNQEFNGHPREGHDEL